MLCGWLCAAVRMPLGLVRAGCWLGVAVLVTVLSSRSRAASPRFGEYSDCESCIAAGFGWSLKKAKCGMFENRECVGSVAASAQQQPMPPPPPQPTPPSSPSPPPTSDGTITVTFAEEGALGLKFGKRVSSAPKGWDVVSIATVQSGSQASQHSALVPGLILNSINGVAITGLRYSETIQLLKGTPRPTTLVFSPGPPPPPPKRKQTPAPSASLPGSARDVGVVLSTAGLNFAEQREQALAHYSDKGECRGMDCYRDSLVRDLAPWATDGISRKVFEQTRTYNINAGRMNHYQIIGGRLYRSGDQRSSLLKPQTCVLSPLQLPSASGLLLCTHTIYLSCPSCPACS